MPISANDFSRRNLLIGATAQDITDLNAALIYLTFADHNVLKFMFNEPAPSDKTVGGGVEDPSQRQNIVSDVAIVQNLYRWTAKAGIKPTCEGDGLLNSTQK